TRVMYDEWISYKCAWDDINIGFIQLSFKCCSISTTTNGSEDDLIFDYDHVKNNNNEVDEYIFSNRTTKPFTPIFALAKLFVSTVSFATRFFGLAKFSGSGKGI
ncbi:14074_t:CDS:2, partial [Gigaspora rosea]